MIHIIMDTFLRHLKEREPEQLIQILSFSFDIFRHDDLKEMLDSNKDSLKLEAMKRIVAVSKPRTFSMFVLFSSLKSTCRYL